MSAATVLILAAGRGTRMRSQKPKVLHEICGRPIVAWVLDAVRGTGAARIVLVDSPEQPLARFAGDDVQIAVQATSNGTGGAALAGLGAAQIGEDSPVLIVNGDVPLVSTEALVALLEAHAEADADATVAAAALDDPAGYGRIVRDADGAFLRVVETKRPGDAAPDELSIREVNAGIYAFRAGALAGALPRLSDANAQGELYLPEVLELIAGEGGRVQARTVGDELLVLGVNDRVDLACAARIAQTQINERHMLGGVTIVDPASTIIDVGVSIGEDTVIEPFTTIRGVSEIGRDCTLRNAYVLDAVVRDGATIGPFAYLRPGADIGPGAKVGSYVEVKNSRVGAKAKIPHLSYIGDADIGERTNLGASTVTANYDGRAKHRTTIGADVRTGVDTTLVAPVTVGDGAVIAAGSVITEDVPARALGIARERQSNVEGYADREPGRA
ncbi:MAG TPA: bifunctional UDP-N-acetylglucosamine diphosphorylase/glucosamine-1-phosphate N-acetyltransferase GlmU [Solirubrobacteraceae bacterium]|nr:bifunctional UDP-N-acetylglucosamine diphosphorylase/glucosamine-1-phosphate N-acetyltransferase GlmU [Solirubrobacteraceae bacterium]